LSRFTASTTVTIVSSRATSARLSPSASRNSKVAATTDVCRRHGISQTTFYKWKAKFGGMGVSKVLRALAACSTLLVFTNSWAGEPIPDGRIKCSLTKGGWWGFSSGEPRLSPHDFVYGPAVHNIEINGRESTWGDYPALVFRGDRGVTIMRNTSTPYLLYVLNERHANGWAALLADTRRSSKATAFPIDTHARSSLRLNTVRVTRRTLPRFRLREPRTAALRGFLALLCGRNRLKAACEAFKGPLGVSIVI